MLDIVEQDFVTAILDFYFLNLTKYQLIFLRDFALLLNFELVPFRLQLVLLENIADSPVGLLELIFDLVAVLLQLFHRLGIQQQLLFLLLQKLYSIHRLHLQ